MTQPILQELMMKINYLTDNIAIKDQKISDLNEQILRSGRIEAKLRQLISDAHEGKFSESRRHLRKIIAKRNEQIFEFKKRMKKNGIDTSFFHKKGKA